MQDFTTHVRWACPSCNHLNNREETVPQLNFSAEKSSDMSVDDTAELECLECGVVYTGHVWVHPSGVEFEMEEPEAFTAYGDMPMYGPDEDYEPPSNPHSIARESLHQLESMVGTARAGNDPQFVNRLIFSGAVSSLEAYLGDTLINAVRHESDVRDQLLQNNRKLGSLSVSAAELASDPDVLTLRVVGALKKILFHNLELVNALYQDAFGIWLCPSNSERDILFPAMTKRHDCVHRNGCDKDGNKLTDFTDEYLLQFIAAIDIVISHIEESRNKSLPF